MKVLFHATPLLLLNMGSFVLIKFLGQGSQTMHLVTQLLLLGLLGVSYMTMMMLWLWIGKLYQLSYVYPLLGLNYVFAVMVGAALFNDPFTWQSLLGGIIIATGVAILSTSPNRLETEQGCG